MARFVRRKILGKWSEGYCLDLHTLNSTFIGHDEFGHPQFDTRRSEAGELLYKLKNKADRSAAPEIVSALEALLKDWNPPIDMIVPVPASARRTVQPVRILAEALGGRLGRPVANSVKRTRDIPQLKNVFDLDERMKLLEGLHAVDKQAVAGKNVLLFDDLYRSGATMNAITAELLRSGAASVYALTVTRTRSNQ